MTKSVRRRSRQFSTLAPGKELAFAVAILASLSGCATIPSGKADPRDRFERANRSIYAFNTALDHAVLRPVARTYVKITPAPARRGVSNFFSNFTYPVTIVNDFLQGKVRDGASDMARFGINTVVGIGGLFDPAVRWGFEKHDEDFGQTLGTWGVPSGPFLMLPLLGPSSVRDAPARLVDTFATPAPYIQNTPARIGLFAAGTVNTRAGLLDADALVDSAYDPYAFVRNAWLQRREYQVKDGKIPPAPAEDESNREDQPHPPASMPPEAPPSPPPPGTRPPSTSPPPVQPQIVPAPPQAPPSPGQ